MKGVMRFGQKGKLSPRYIGPFEILKRVGKLAYELALPPSLSGIHGTFHVSMLRKYIAYPSHVLTYEALELKPNLSYEEKPVQILDRRLKELRNKSIPLVKMMLLLPKSKKKYDFQGWLSTPSLTSGILLICTSKH
ncbi:uncharacterized protein LOC112094196 [Morus notabilis]|uniref:uncharacterized protein LOC112094196 n=1 Tax=Morus notabilis TaxID=981085 RepID=UPI000CED6193|nr:uncharacterized protein LOC112094196 [Morus notabilis]